MLISPETRRIVAKKGWYLLGDKVYTNNPDKVIFSNPSIKIISRSTK